MTSLPKILLFPQVRQLWQVHAGRAGAGALPRHGCQVRAQDGRAHAGAQQRVIM